MRGCRGLVLLPPLVLAVGSTGAGAARAKGGHERALGMTPAQRECCASLVNEGGVSDAW